MKRMITGIVAVMLTTSVAVTPAQAASADPVKVLKSRFVVGKGVKFTDVTTTVAFAGKTSILKRTGSLQFGRGGIVASDISSKRAGGSAGVFDRISWALASERTIRIGTTSYYSGDGWAPPKGKIWVKHPHGMTGGFSGRYSQRVNVAEPATLDALITSGKRVGRTYSGAISFAKLDKISPWFRDNSLISSKTPTVMRFKLTLGPDQLPQRLITSYPASVHFVKSLVEDMQVSVETRYTGWGSRVAIKAPPASKVETVKKAEPLSRGGGRS
jgi:hypothetical protein